MNDRIGPDQGDEHVLREIEERIRRRLAVVEQDNQSLRARMRVLGVGLVLTVALLALVAVAPDALAIVGIRQSDDVVEAGAFRLLDANGIARGEWSVDEAGTARLTLLDPQRRQRLNVAVLESGSPGIALVNANGQRRAALGLLPDETTTLVFADARGTPRAVFGLTQTDAANLILADAEGITRMGLGLDGGGMGSVMLPEAESEGDSPERSGGGG